MLNCVCWTRISAVVCNQRWRICGWKLIFRWLTASASYWVDLCNSINTACRWECVWTDWPIIQSGLQAWIYTHSAGIKVMEPGGGLKPASTRASPEVTPQQWLTVSNTLMQLPNSGQCKQRAQDVTQRRTLIPAADQSEQWLLLVPLLLLTTNQSSVYKNAITFKT